MTIWVCETEQTKHGQYRITQLAVLEYEGFHIEQSNKPPAKLQRYVCPICKSSVKVKKE